MFRFELGLLNHFLAGGGYCISNKASRTWWYIAAVIIVVVVVAVGVYLLYMQPGGTSTVTVTKTLYEGELSASQYGFGTSATSLASPGPTLTFKVGDVVKMTVYNVGTLPHSWEINTKQDGSGQMLFSSVINPGSTIAPGGSGTVTFTVTQAGSFYYVCPIAGHPELGMYGTVTVSS
jgi:uncharacterized cupredoxin-like copper-binding protein